MDITTHKYIHPSDGLEMTYKVHNYAKNGRMLISTIRGDDLGYKQATGEARTYQIERHNAVSWAAMIHQGVTTVPPYVSRFPSSWLPVSRQHLKTPRIRENFLKCCYLESDDDTGDNKTVDFWHNDPFFSKYGYSFIESSSSTSSAQKGHPFLVFDIDREDRLLYEDAMKAWIFYYGDRADRTITSSNRLSYHKVGSKNHILGHICPFEVYRKTFLVPYYDHIDNVRIQRGRQRAKKRRDIPVYNGVNSTRLNKYARVVFNNLIEELANASAGNRHYKLINNGYKLGMLANAEWHNIDPYDIISAITDACVMNGYTGQYGKEDVLSTLRIWESLDGWELPF